MGALRAERVAYQRKYVVAAGLLPDLDRDTTLLINDWHFAGRGHPPPVTATLLLSGVPVHVVAARLDRTNPAITLRVYAHVIRLAEAATAEIFAQAAKAA